MSALMLGIDLGTSSVKLCLMDESGEVIASARREYPVIGQEEGFYEQNPEDWTSAIASAMNDIHAFAGDICSVGLSAQMPTLVASAPGGELLHNAVLWRDARAEQQGRELLELWGEERHYRKTGIVLDGRYIIPMARRLEQNAEVDLTKSHLLLSAKDYLCMKLTGNAVTDPSTASGFGVYSLEGGGWDDFLCGEAGIDTACLPKVADSGSIAGYLTEEAAKSLGLRAGIPVITGCADSVSGVLGTGAAKPGALCQMWGSSTALIAVKEKPVLSAKRRYLVTPLAAPRTYGCEADILSTGGAMSRLLTLTGQTDGPQLFETAKKAPPGSDGLLIYPYLSGGEQGVLWEQSLRGGILGLTDRHHLGHIVRSLLEGMCFEVKRCAEAFQEDGCSISKSFCGGFISKTPFFMQMLADILAVPCVSVNGENASAAGAAYIAGVGTDVFSFEDIGRMAPAGATYMPGESEAAVYKPFYDRYIRNTENMKPR